VNTQNKRTLIIGSTITHEEGFTMKLLDTIIRPKVKVFDLAPLPEYRGDGAVRGREVALWRPPIMLDRAGRTMQGVSKDLVAGYLVAMTNALAKADLGPVTVTWKAQEGRFATTTLTIHAWNAEVDVLHPVAVVSQKLANALEHYRAGMALKCRELHKGHQDFEASNQMLRRAAIEIEKLRDDTMPHFADNEFLFIQANLSKALTLSALLPVSEGGAEQAIGTNVTI
jgi:hypothetical protein